MRAKLLYGKWVVEVNTEEFGKVILLDPNKESIPLYFDTREKAEMFIESSLKKLSES